MTKVEPPNGDRGHFPEQTAAIVLRWADETGMGGVREAVDTVRGWVGRPEVLVAREAAWIIAAQVHIKQADDGLWTIRENQSAYWEGRAAESFGNYLDRLGDATKEVADGLLAFSVRLRELRDELLRTYRVVLNALADCATGLLEAGQTFFGALPDLWGGGLAAGLQAMGTFVEVVTTTVDTMLGVLQGFTNARNDFRRLVHDLPVPDALPGSVGEVDNWVVRPAEGA